MFGRAHADLQHWDYALPLRLRRPVERGIQLQGRYLAIIVILKSIRHGLVLVQVPSLACVINGRALRHLSFDVSRRCRRLRSPASFALLLLPVLLIRGLDVLLGELMQLPVLLIPHLLERHVFYALDAGGLGFFLIRVAAGHPGLVAGRRRGGGDDTNGHSNDDEDDGVVGALLLQHLVHGVCS